MLVYRYYTVCNEIVCCYQCISIMSAITKAAWVSVLYRDDGWWKDGDGDICVAAAKMSATATDNENNSKRGFNSSPPSMLWYIALSIFVFILP